MVGLTLLTRYFSELEADFQHYYQLDLTGLFTGGLSLRRFVNLAVNIPPGASVWRAHGGPMAFTPLESMVAFEGARVASAVSGAHVRPVSPPDVGWREKQKAADARQQRRLANWLRRNKL